MKNIKLKHKKYMYPKKRGSSIRFGGGGGGSLQGWFIFIE